MIESEATAAIADATEFCGNSDYPAWNAAGNTIFGDLGLFFRAWLNQPATIGAVMPTRAPLARAMARAAGAIGGPSIVELGGGTGPITRALIESGIAPERLTIVERNPVFHRLLTNRFPSLRIFCGDAENLRNVLGMNAGGRIDVVVSSLPRLGWPLARQRSILEQCFSLLQADGIFLEFSYGPFSPVPLALVKSLGLAARRVRRVWGNFPPATVWGYRRAQAGA